MYWRHNSQWRSLALSDPGMQFLRAVQSAARGIADLAAEELRDALLPLGLGAALREAPRDAALGGAVDVQRRRQATCAGASKSSRLLTGE